MITPTRQALAHEVFFVEGVACRQSAPQTKERGVMMLRRATLAIGRGPHIRTGPLPRLPMSALSGAKTMESVALPGAILLALAALAAIQLALTW